MSALSRRLTRVTTAAFAVAVAVLLCAPFPANAATIELAGTVTDAITGSPIAGVFVSAYRYDETSGTYGYAGLAVTDAGGAYAFGADSGNSIPDGLYRIEFADPSGVYAPEVFDNMPKSSPLSADVSIAAGVTSIANADLAPGHTISGQVFGFDGLPLQNGWVQVLDAGWNVWAETQTNAAGEFALELVPDGSYQLLVSDELYSTLAERAVNVEGADLAGVVFSPAMIGALSDATTANALADVLVSSYIYDAAFDAWLTGPTTWSDTAGRWGFYDIAAESYRLQFDLVGYRTEYYDNVTDFDTALPVTYDGSTRVSGLDAALSPLAIAISGTVTDGVTGDPIEGAEVTSYRYDGVDWVWVTTEYSAADGTYGTALASGTYRMGVSAVGYFGEYYADAPGVWDAADLMFDGAEITGVDFALAPALELAPDGFEPDDDATTAKPITIGAPAQAHTFAPPADQDWVTFTADAGETLVMRTWEAGGYGCDTVLTLFDDTGAVLDGNDDYIGLYSRIVHTFADSGTYYLRVAEFGDNAGTYELTVGPNVPSIAGTVTDDSTGDPLVDVEVDAFAYDAPQDAWIAQDWTFTAADGTYEFFSLGESTWRVGFNPWSGIEMPLSGEYWDNQPTVWTADGVPTAVGDTMAGIDASLTTRAPSISGQLTDAVTGDPVPGGFVGVYEDDATLIGICSVRADGSYAVYGLQPAGTYYLRFWDEEGFYVPEDYNEVPVTTPSPDPLVATPVVATVGTLVIDEELLPAPPSITGTVVRAGDEAPLAGVPVVGWVYDAGVGEWTDTFWTSTDVNGDYAFYGMPDGEYRVSSPGNLYYAGALYDGLPLSPAASVGIGTPVTVAAPTTASGIDLQLAQLPPLVQGAVTDADTGQPLGGIDVGVYTYDEFDAVYYQSDWPITAADGTWQSWPSLWMDPTLPYEGATLVAFNENRTTAAYTSQWFDGAATMGTATSIDIARGSTVGAVDAALTPLPASAAGIVSDASSGDPVEGVRVAALVYDADTLEWLSVGEAVTGADGSWTLFGLPDGAYKLQFEDAWSFRYFGEYYNDKADPGSADAIDVVAPGTAGPFLTALTPVPPAITGTVTDEATGDPIAGIWAGVNVFDAGFGEWVEIGGGITGVDGAYAVEMWQSHDGPVRLSFADWNDVWAPEVYDNAASLEAGDDIAISPGATAAGVDAALTQRPPAISGMVTDEVTGLPLEGVSVSWYQYQPATGSWDGGHGAFSGADGTYSLRGLAPGDYRIGFSKWDTHVDEYYADAVTVFGADTVTITGTPITGLDAALAPLPPAITGTVTDAATALPLADIWVDAQRYDAATLQWVTVSSAFSGTDGTYSVPAIDEGTQVRVLFSDDTGRGYQSQYFDGSAVASGTWDLVLTPASGIDAAMVKTPVVDVAGPALFSDAEASYLDTATILMSAFDPSGVATLTYSVDGAAPVAVAGASATAVVFGGGLHTLEYWAVDTLGNESDPHAVDIFSIDDTQDPVVTSDAKATYANEATITITASDVSGIDFITYVLDGVESTVASGVVTVHTAQPGAHTLDFFAVDAFGNTSATRSAPFMVNDTIAPSTAFLAPQASYNDSATISVAASDTGGVDRIAHRVDGGGWVDTPIGAASGSVDVEVSGYGTHTVEFTARDEAGNEAGGKAHTFFIDDTRKPMVVSTVQATYDATASFTISAGDGGSGVAYLYIKRPGEGYHLASGATETETVGWGAHTYLAYAIDNRGNVSDVATLTTQVREAVPSAPVVDVTVDTSNPFRVSIAATATDDLSGVKRLWLRFTSPYGSGTEIVPGNVGQLEVSSMWDQSTPGNYTWEFYAEDWSGNVTTPHVVVDFAVANDTAGPSIQVPTEVSYANTASFVVTATDAGVGLNGFHWGLDQDAMTNQTYPSGAAVATVAVSASTYGTHTVNLYADDTRGNSTASAYTFFIDDTIAPAATSTVNTAVGSASVSLTASDNVGGSGLANVTYWVTLAGASHTPTATASSPTTFTITGPGAYVVHYFAQDAEGNRSATVDRAVTVPAPPVATGLYNPASRPTFTTWWRRAQAGF